MLRSRSIFWLVITICIALLLRLWLATQAYCGIDIRSWYDDIYIIVYEGHYFDFYSVTNLRFPGMGYKYPPLWAAILVLVDYGMGGLVNHTSHSILQKNIFCWHILTALKFPILIADIMTGALIYLYVSQEKSEKHGLIGASLWLFNPFLLYISAIWGMFDSLCVFFIVLSMYLLKKKMFMASVASLGLVSLTKQYAWFTLLSIFIVIWKQMGRRKAITCFTGIIAIFMAASTPFLIFDREAYLSNILYVSPSRSLYAAQPYDAPIRIGSAWWFLSLIPIVPEDALSYALPLTIGLTFIISVLFAFTPRRDEIPNLGLEAYLTSASIFLLFNWQVHETYYVFALAPICIMVSLRKTNPLTYIPWIGMFIIYFWRVNDFFKTHTTLYWLSRPFYITLHNEVTPFLFYLYFFSTSFIALTVPLVLTIHQHTKNILSCKGGKK